MGPITTLSDLSGSWTSGNIPDDEMLRETLDTLARLISNYGRYEIPGSYPRRRLDQLVQFVNYLNEGYALSDEERDKLYCCVYALMLRLNFEYPDSDIYKEGFVRYREKLPPELGFSLVHDEVSFVSAIYDRAKLSSNFELINSYMDEVGRFDGRIRQVLEAQVRLEELSKKLDEREVAFNFVGLYEGFHSLWLQKKKELFWQKGALIGLGVCVVIPLLLKLMHSFVSTAEDLNIPLLATVGALELVLIYFFRIILHSVNSTKAQLLQIDLRRTLCQFIQKYAECSKELKEGNPGALEKFETLIFSGLVMQDDKLPTTFDGLEPIQKIFAGRAGKAGASD